MAGWIALFDGKTDFGWEDAKVVASTIAGGKTTSVFGACELQGEAADAGELALGDEAIPIAAGKFHVTLIAARPGPISLGAGLRLKSLLLRPVGLQTILNGRDLQGWKTLPHPKLPADRQATWKLEEGSLHARGGPVAMEFETPYGDVMLQIVARMRTPLVNGGLFFGSIPRQF